MVKLRKLYSTYSLCFLALAIAAHGQNPTSSTPITAADASAASAVPATAAGLANRGDSPVRLGTGDLIDVNVYNVPELNTKTRVSGAGDVYLPLVDYVHVGGLTINDAEAVIEKRLDEGGFVKSPHVQLFVDEYTSGGAAVLGE